MSVQHLDDEDLEGYLHRSLLPTRRGTVHRHLDACAPCWDRWNRHRWDAARRHPLHDELAAFLGPGFQPYLDSSRAFAAEWDQADPRTPHEMAAFFRTSTSYLHNLAIWEASGNRPDYLAAALPYLAASNVHTVLDIGSGIGSDALALQQRGYTVTACDYDSPSTRFARRHSCGTLPHVEPDGLGAEHAADVLWIVDTLDHLPDPAGSLGRLLPRARIVITEDMRDNRAHGRQRFHHRRPLAETTRLFARHRLNPNTHGPIMTWTRDEPHLRAATRTPNGWTP